MRYLFSKCTQLETLDLKDVELGNVTDMSYMFYKCSSLKSIDIPTTTYMLKDAGTMFYGCKSLTNLDIRNLYTSNVTDMSTMFACCESLQEIDLKNLDTRNAQYIYGMFYGCKNIKELDVSNFVIKQDVELKEMFNYCDDMDNFKGCELFNDVYFTDTEGDFSRIQNAWKSQEKKLKYAAFHIPGGKVFQIINHEGIFNYPESGDFLVKNSTASVNYSCDFKNFRDSSYSYSQDLCRMSIRIALAAMGTSNGDGSENIKALMNDLNFGNQYIHYVEPEYDSIGYAIGCRNIYIENKKHTVILVAIRGGGYKQEWAGNANVGLGKNHAGFELAANQTLAGLDKYVEELKKTGLTENGKIDVWICGYSRAAATANLLAAELDQRRDDNIPENLKYVDVDHIRAFCFECPKNTQYLYKTEPLYSNIYNIINPKDIVTKVAMNNNIDWHFGRYGRDLVIPDDTNTNATDFDKYNNLMRSKYYLKQVSSIPTVRNQQAYYAKELTLTLSKINYLLYKIQYQTAIQQTILNKMVNSHESDLDPFEDIFTVILALPPISQQVDVVSTGLLLRDITHPHVPEFCMAWMDALDADTLLKSKSSTYVYINCPVDISVYQQNNLVAQISNDVVQEIQNGIVTYVDKDGQKLLILPGDSEYRIEYKATGNGNMTITTCNYVDDETVPSSVSCYFDLPITAGSLYEGNVTNGICSIRDTNQSVINPSIVQNGEDAKTYKVEVTSSGNGRITGGGIYNIGEFAKLTAIPDVNSKFLGWYDNDQLISSDLSFRMCVKKDSTIIGKFADEPQKLDNNKTKIYVVSKNKYKITNTKKRTVTFIGTKSKAKTIKIPATIKINKKVYKVTAIAEKALSNNKKITKVEIGTNIITIGSKAFYNCKNLKYILVKSTKVKKVGKYAFKGIKSSAKIKLPSRRRKTYMKLIKKSKISNKIKFI